MFNPRYTITSKILNNIKEITSLTTKLNLKRYPKTILLKFEKMALEQSTYSSTSIEGNPLSLTEVKKILKNKPQHIRDTEREVLNYNEALEYLKIITDKSASDTSYTKSLEMSKILLNDSLILKIHKKVTSGLILKADEGKYRNKPVVVNNPRNGKIVYLPPNYKDVNKLMEELIGFINKNMLIIDPIILSGIFHKHFVVIHPFIDGNGRTARLLTKFLLSRMGLNTFNLFSFENYYNKNVSEYFKNVGVFGDYYEIKNSIDFTNWLEYFTDGIIDELTRLFNELSKASFNPETSMKLHDKKIITYIESNGYITDSTYKKITNRAKATRALDFKRLAKLGVLKRKGGGRSTYYTLK